MRDYLRFLWCKIEWTLLGKTQILLTLVSGTVILLTLPILQAGISIRVGVHNIENMKCETLFDEFETILGQHYPYTGDEYVDETPKPPFH